jgi:hypothetical protein
MIIENGGSEGGYKVIVDEEGKLQARCITSELEFHTNDHEGGAYSLTLSYTPTGAGDCFGYITNNSNVPLIISALMFYAASDEFFLVKLGDEGTASGGASVTPVNRNAGSGNLADVTAEGAVDITGLSGGSVVAGMFKEGGTSSTKVEIKSGIIIPKNKTVSFYVETGAIAVRVGVEMYFHG